MKKQMDDSSPAMNELAKASRWLGICSLVPYPIFMLYHIEIGRNSNFFQLGLIIEYFCLVWGISFGLASLISGNAGMKEIIESKGTETGMNLATLGRALGILGIIANILFIFFLLFAAFALDY